MLSMLTKVNFHMEYHSYAIKAAARAIRMTDSAIFRPGWEFSSAALVGTGVEGLAEQRPAARLWVLAQTVHVFCFWQATQLEIVQAVK